MLDFSGKYIMPCLYLTSCGSVNLGEVVGGSKVGASGVTDVNAG